MRKVSINNAPKKKQRGMSLPSAVFGMALGAIVLISLVAIYQQRVRVTEREQFREEMLRVFGELKSSKITYRTYQGTSNQSVYQSDRMINQQYKSPTANQFTTPFSDNGLTFVPVGSATNRAGNTFTSANNYIQVTIADVPIEQCSDVVDDFMEAVVQVNVGTTRVHTIATRDAACSTGSTVDVVLINN